MEYTIRLWKNIASASTSDEAWIWFLLLDVNENVISSKICMDYKQIFLSVSEPLINFALVTSGKNQARTGE